MAKSPFLDLSAASLLVTAMGLIVFLISMRRSFSFARSLPFALDFFLAAGLLRLSESVSWRVLATSATIVLMRKAVSLSLGRSRKPNPAVASH